MPNTTMTYENVSVMVDGFDGDFIGFQAYFEAVSRISRGRLPTSTYLFATN